jgi:UDP-3-O-[3-hydroxymyristoyl] glucosamine N-acyltransferase
LEKDLREIAGIIKGKVIGDENIRITGINSVDKAIDGEISFFVDNRYRGFLKETKASALIVSAPVEDYSGTQVIVSDPKLAYARAAGIFAPPVSRYEGLSKNALIEETSFVGNNVSIYPFVYVGQNAVIGDNVTLYPGAFIGDRVRIGDGTVVYSNVSIMRDCILGKDVIVHAGCVIGSDGFGYVRDGSENVKVPQLGIVQIDDNVEIGANTTIDRATNGRTWIKSGVKIDNTVQIAHNVTIGEDTILLSLSGISGSTIIGREVIIGGQAGVKDHIEIGDSAIIGPRTGVHKSIKSGEMVLGDPSMPYRLWMRVSSLIAKLPQINDRLKTIENRFKEQDKDIN